MVHPKDNLGGQARGTAVLRTASAAAQIVGVAVLLSGCTWLVPQSGEPDWVALSGLSARFPRDRYLTGYAQLGPEATLESARSAASGVLATKISVRIEHELRDVSAERDGEYSYHVAAVTRSTSDVRVNGLEHEVYRDREGVYALAVLDRVQEAKRRRQLRDEELQELRACLAASSSHLAAGFRSKAVRSYARCRRPLAEALEQEAVARSLVLLNKQDTEVVAELIRAARSIDEGVDAALSRPVDTFADGIESIVLQLYRQGVPQGARVSATPLAYGTTELSSEFGRQVALDLKVALARHGTSSSEFAPHVLLRGFYREQEGGIRLSVIAKNAENLRLVGSAEILLPKDAIDPDWAILPLNFDQAITNHRVLAEPLFQGELQLEFWTDKGRRGLVYYEDERLTLFLRINAPAWIRIVYVLANGAQVPVEKALYVGPNMANRVIRYPDDFKIVAPFGIEYFHVAAFGSEPSPIPTKEVWIEGERYEVLTDGIDALKAVRRNARSSEAPFSEAFLAVTTAARARPTN